MRLGSILDEPVYQTNLALLAGAAVSAAWTETRKPRPNACKAGLALSIPGAWITEAPISAHTSTRMCVLPPIRRRFVPVTALQ